MIHYCFKIYLSLKKKANRRFLLAGFKGVVLIITLVTMANVLRPVSFISKFQIAAQTTQTKTTRIAELSIFEDWINLHAVFTENALLDGVFGCSIEQPEYASTEI